MKNDVFLNVTPRASSTNLSFGATHRVLRLLVTVIFILISTILSPWWWRRYVPRKSLRLQEPHGVTFQNTALFSICPHFSLVYVFYRPWYAPWIVSVVLQRTTFCRQVFVFTLRQAQPTTRNSLTANPSSPPGRSYVSSCAFILRF
jgi:hypothetical protein